MGEATDRAKAMATLRAALDRMTGERDEARQALKGIYASGANALLAELNERTKQRDEAEAHISKHIGVVKGLERELDEARAHSEAMEWQHEQANKRIEELEAELDDARRQNIALRETVAGAVAIVGRCECTGCQDGAELIRDALTSEPDQPERKTWEGEMPQAYWDASGTPEPDQPAERVGQVCGLCRPHGNHNPCAECADPQPETED